jgi:hypothetical protein
MARRDRCPTAGVGKQQARGRDAAPHVRRTAPGVVQHTNNQDHQRITQMSVRSDIITQFTQVGEEHNRPLAPLVDDLRLMQSGLDSLCFAVVVARLEDVVGIDPFTAAEDAPFPVTLGDFIRFYENAAS